ncbi:MAG: anthranilate phosphoribosyltransferase [Candidatus Bathyarchaeia archaeon]
MIRQGISKLVHGIDLTYLEAEEIMKEIMSGDATEAQISALLTALAIKGETIQEISAFASVMREFCNRINPEVSSRLVDTCGTGGDRVKTFNVSTASAFVIAGAGVNVAKHGNRSVTSKSGSADVLERLGLNLNLEPEAVERVVEEVGIGFMFAPRFHPAMKHCTGPRRQIGIRTVFNILGPLTNPASADAQLLGVYGKEWVEPLAHALKELGCEEAMVVHGAGGMDELSTIGKTSIAWLREGEVSLKEITPEQFGLEKARAEDIRGELPEQSAELLFRLLNDCLKPGDPRLDIVLLNAGAGILVGGKVNTWEEGIELAKESIESGAAYEKMKKMIKASGGVLEELEELEQRYA